MSASYQLPKRYIWGCPRCGTWSRNPENHCQCSVSPDLLDATKVVLDQDNKIDGIEPDAMIETQIEVLYDIDLFTKALINPYEHLSKSIRTYLKTKGLEFDTSESEFATIVDDSLATIGCAIFEVED